MKVGFVVHFFDFRNDVRRVINDVARQHEVVLFARAADAESMRPYLPPKAELRVVKEKKNTWRNRLWEQLFRLCGQLPRSYRNYYLMEVLKISLLENASLRKKVTQMLNFSMKLPHFLSYDDYLNKLTYSANTPVNDIDLFICFTDISEDYFFARLVRERRPLKVYVYSWDHPCKQKRYSKRVNYLVWNEGLKQDMVELQGVDPERVTISGASQFAYVDQFYKLEDVQQHNPFPFPYIYFGCAVGAPVIAIKEVKIIERISRLLSEIAPHVKLVVRPYPVLKDWKVVQNLTQACPNVVLDDQYKSKDMSMSEGNIMDKFIRMHHALAFIHLGTTLGFEACFTDTPSILIDFSDLADDQSPLSLHSFVHQYQNEKYLMLKGYPNVVRSEAELQAVLQTAIEDKSRLLAYNKAVSESTQVVGFEEFAGKLVPKFVNLVSLP